MCADMPDLPACSWASSRNFSGSFLLGPLGPVRTPHSPLAQGSSTVGFGGVGYNKVGLGSLAAQRRATLEPPCDSAPIKGTSPHAAPAIEQVAFPWFHGCRCRELSIGVDPLQCDGTVPASIAGLQSRDVKVSDYESHWSKWHSSHPGSFFPELRHCASVLS